MLVNVIADLEEQIKNLISTTSAKYYEIITKAKGNNKKVRNTKRKTRS